MINNKRRENNIFPLLEKPANPIAFMIEYLHKQYPDQAKLAMPSGAAAAAAVPSPAL